MTILIQLDKGIKRGKGKGLLGMSYQDTKHMRPLLALPEASFKLIGSGFSKSQMNVPYFY